MGSHIFLRQDQLHILAVSSNILSSRSLRTGSRWRAQGLTAMKQQRTSRADVAKDHAFSTGERHLKQDFGSIVYLPPYL